jgi:hypothetical protein
MNMRINTITAFSLMLIFSVMATKPMSLLPSIQEATTYATQHPIIATTSGLALATVGAFAGYKLLNLCHDQFKQHIENKIVEQAANNIVLALTANKTLQLLPESERVQAFKDKAHLINMRKRVLVTLNTTLKNDPFSPVHHKNLDDKLELANTVFTIVDLFRTENPYEKEYANPTMYDTFIENKIVDSIILSCKPTEECTPDELKLKSEIEARREKIIENVSNKVGVLWRGRILALAGFIAVVGGAAAL